MTRRRLAKIVTTVVALTLLLAARHAQAGPPAQQGTLGVQAPADATALAPLGTSFTYQGRLLEGSNAASGAYDFQFSLYDAASDGTQVGGVVSKEDVPVTQGLFIVELDFGGGVFSGAARWLEIAVRPGSSSGAYTTLAPRVALTAVPYAHSLRPGASVETASGTALSLSTSGTSGTALNAVASANSGNAAAVYGSSSSPDGAGVSGYNATSGSGVYGAAAGSTGTPYGVYGLASHAGSATSFGVYGKSNSSVGTGVGGEAPRTGVSGKATATNGYGVYGEASAGSGNTYGVYGKASSVLGKGVYGEASAGSGSTYGVYGKAGSVLGTGSYGQGGYYGVYGLGTDPAGITYGVYGISTGASGYGVWGQGTHREGVHGGSTFAAGVYGLAPMTGTVGVATAESGSTWGVYGKSSAPSGYGVYGENTANGITYGVYGINDSGLGAGVMGTSKIAAGTGVRGLTADGHGVEGSVDCPAGGNGIGVYGDGGLCSHGGWFENETAGRATVVIENRNYVNGGPALDVRGTTVITGDVHVNGDLTWGPKTGYVSISPAAFQPESNEFAFQLWGFHVTRNQWLDQNLVQFYADAQLPHQAVVTKFTVYWSLLAAYPPTPAYFHLVAADLRAVGAQHMATVTTWSEDEDIRRWSSTTSITDPVVRNDLYTYYVRAALPGYVRVHGVVIEYEFSEPY